MLLELVDVELLTQVVLSSFNYFCRTGFTALYLRLYLVPSNMSLRGPTKF